MKRRFYAPTVLFIGLLSAQIVATAHVHMANMDLLQTTEAVMRSGFLPVPNAGMYGRLESWGTALAGGVFFTLSIGAGLSLTALVAAWLWDRLFQRRLRVAIGYLVVWIFFFCLVNSDGFNLAASTYTIVVPLAAGLAAVLLMPARTTLISPFGIIWPASAALILALSWSLVLDGNIFTNIRDHLLLASRPGRQIVDAYYKYTLYPANAYQSLTQKQIRTCVLDTTIDPAQIDRIEAAVRGHDWLPVAPGFPADLIIANDTADARLILGNSRRRVLSISSEAFLNRPGEILGTYADRLDNNRMFRRLTLAGLLLGFPLVLFGLIYSLLSAVPNLVLKETVSDGITTLLCIILGIALLVPVYRGRTAMAANESPIADLSASSSRVRIAALRHACERQMDVTLAARQASLPTSPYVAERYWLARSLANANHPQATAMLQALVKDPAIIVVCQALWATGQRQNRTAIPQIIRRLNTDPHWYIQMYAYRALRSLGWVQPRSPRHS